MRNCFKALLPLFVIGLLFVSIVSPMVEASIVFGPVQYTRTTGSPDVYDTNFSIDDPRGNYTLYMKNGDLITNGSDVATNSSSSSVVWFNGQAIFKSDDFKKPGGLLVKNISADKDNLLKVEMRSIPGSLVYAWVEDDSPDIVITSPTDDSICDTPIMIEGYVTDKTITEITININGNVSTAEVTDGNFSATVNLGRSNNITISATDRTGTLRSTSLLLDGDRLPAQVELALGFDPLDPDSDSTLTTDIESGNGIPDGQEVLNKANGEKLRCYVKYMIGADPLKVDSNDNGLTDYFELIDLYITDVSSNTSEAMALPAEDPDGDGLTNIREQELGTDPMAADTDGDGISDGFEINISLTDPLLGDTDNDGLADASEVKIGTDPRNVDTDNDGVLDGAEIYTTTASNETLGISVSITGTGDMSKKVRIVPETSSYYTNNSALSSQLVDVSVSGPFDHAVIKMKYDPGVVTDPANYSLCYYNESLGLFLPVPSTVDTVNHTISANVTHLSLWGIFNLNALQSLYTAVANFNEEIAGYVSGTAAIVQNIVNDAQNPIKVTKTYMVDPATNKVVISNMVTFPGYGSTTPGSTPTPTPGPIDYSPIVITMNNRGQINWFGKGASFPVGVYQINATGWYAHWYPPPSELACIDMGSDRSVRMYAWSGRGNNYPYANVRDTDRLGMHVRYGSNDEPVYKLRIEPGTLQINHSGGQIGMWDKDDAYNDNTYNLQYVLAYVGTTPPAQDLTDTDRDGLPDRLETHGWMDTQGNVYVTDPNNPDTDSDGLMDGEEAGTWVQLNLMKYFQAASDPKKVDSDDDRLNDANELESGTKAFKKDTDGDSLSDGYEVLGWEESYYYMEYSYLRHHVYYGTDPLEPDTDFDGWNDFEETLGTASHWYAPGGTDLGTVYDPLIKESNHIDPMPAFWKGFWEGYNSSSPYTDNYYYNMGVICGSYVPVYGSGRDMGVAERDGDTFSYYLNGFFLFLDVVPIAGQGDDVLKTVKMAIKVEDTAPLEAKLAVQNIKNAEEQGLKNSKLAQAVRSNALDESVTSADILRDCIGPSYDSMHGAGFSNKYIGELVGEGINVERLDDILTEYRIYDDFPGLAVFMENLKIEKGVINDKVIIDLKRLTIPGRTSNQISGDMSNLIGAFGEYRMDKNVDGTIVIGLSRVHDPGIDEVKENLNVFKMCESKGTILDYLPISKFRNYIQKIDGTYKLNKNYIYLDLKEKGIANPGKYFNDRNIEKRLVIYITGPKSEEVKSSLISQLPSDMRVEYVNDFGETDYVTVEIIADNLQV